MREKGGRERERKGVTEGETEVKVRWERGREGGADMLHRRL